MTFGVPESNTPVCDVRDCPGFGTKHGPRVTSDDMTRVLSLAGETIATYGPEWYAGHVATIVYELNPHLRVQSTEDGGKTWTDVTDRTIPFA